jgi:dTDP-4-amino-4,6-dideoxygalactose transaminase
LFDDISVKHGVKVIYDGAHAFGVKYCDKSLLSYGDAVTLSFHATKVFHTVEGGAVIFKDKSRYDRAKQLINFGLSSSGVPKEAGINAKLNEYQAAVGLTLLDSIDDILEHRSRLFDTYANILESYVALPSWNTNTSFKNGSYFPIILESQEEKSRIKILLKKLDIPSREYFSPSLDMVFNPLHSCVISQEVASRVLCLPLHYYLSVKEVSYIASTIKKGRS